MPDARSAETGVRRVGQHALDAASVWLQKNLDERAVSRRWDAALPSLRASAVAGAGLVFGGGDGNAAPPGLAGAPPAPEVRPGLRVGVSTLYLS